MADENTYRGAAKVTAEDIKPGLQYCTHLIYGYAGIDDDDYVIKSIDENLVLDSGKAQYRAATNLKAFNSGLKVLLSIGGFGDTDDLEKYYEVLENIERRTKFINSVHATLKQFNFDGVDLAWRFPEVKEKKDRNIFSSAWHGLKKAVGVGVDDKWAEHRDQFVSLVRELKAAMRTDSKLLSLGVLPHVNATAYYDVRNLAPQVDFVNLWTFDFRTPKRSKVQADYSAPLYYMYDRNPQQNADAHVTWWTSNGCDPSKLNLGIPTFGRSWELTTESPISGVPPLLADGAGDEGTYSKIKGTLAYYETCTRVVSPTNARAPSTLLRRVTDPTKRLGTYAYRLPQKDKDEEEGFWLSYEEPETAAYKAAYAKAKGLGGVVLVDLSLDDARGACDGTKFPILRSAKMNL
ncbi:hypothetical protein J6590_023543 [Homalodisca vitripennis]|nr:hypothetical protein J6590_023543 [Homalodisca vitripennis]